MPPTHASPKPRSQPGPRQSPVTPPPAVLCEAIVAEGLEAVAQDEIARRCSAALDWPRTQALAQLPGSVRFFYAGPLHALLDLKTVIAVALVRHFPAPRPRALLGDQHLRALLDQIATVRTLSPPGAYQTLYLSAAGSDTSTLLRLKETLATQTGLRVVPHDGDLQLRLRRPPEGDGWEVLARLSPRPLVTRPWRVCNFAGALNAAVAHAMALLSAPRQDDVALNLACGSGTLLIERLACLPARRALGCDTSAVALDCARANVAASGYGERIELYPWDAQSLPLPDSSVDVLYADLPFGHLVGSHAENLALYPAVLREAGRVARPGARFVLIAHEVRLMESLLASAEGWATAEVHRVSLRGLHPRIFIVRRVS